MNEPLITKGSIASGGLLEVVVAVLAAVEVVTALAVLAIVAALAAVGVVTAWAVMCVAVLEDETRLAAVEVVAVVVVAVVEWAALVAAEGVCVLLEDVVAAVETAVSRGARAAQDSWLGPAAGLGAAELALELALGVLVRFAEPAGLRAAVLAADGAPVVRFGRVELAEERVVIGQ